VGATGS